MLLRKFYSLIIYSKFYQKIKKTFKLFDHSFNNRRSELIENSLKYYFLLSYIKKKQIKIVECGVGMGESLSYIHKVSKLMNFDTKIWAFDSFQGFPNLRKI